jgi:hypothetical protein
VIDLKMGKSKKEKNNTDQLFEMVLFQFEAH